MQIGERIPQHGDQIAVRNPSYWSQPSTWGSEIIRWGTNSYWNHWAGIEVRPDGVMYVVEMRGGGKKNARRKTRYEIWQQRSPDRIYQILPGFAITSEQMDSLSGGYDYFSLCFRQPVYIVSGRFFSLFKREIAGIWIGGKKDHTYTCSEYWARLAQQFGPAELSTQLREAYKMAPRDLARVFGAVRL